MNDPLGVRPSKGNQGTTRGKEKILLTSVGIEPTTSRFPLLCRLSYEVPGFLCPTWGETTCLHKPNVFTIFILPRRMSFLLFQLLISFF